MVQVWKCGPCVAFLVINYLKNCALEIKCACHSSLQFFFNYILCTTEYLASYVFVRGAGNFLWRTGVKYEAHSVALSPTLLYLPVNVRRT